MDEVDMDSTIASFDDWFVMKKKPSAAIEGTPSGSSPGKGPSGKQGLAAIADSSEDDDDDDDDNDNDAGDAGNPPDEDAGEAEPDHPPPGKTRITSKGGKKDAKGGKVNDKEPPKTEEQIKAQAYDVLVKGSRALATLQHKVTCMVLETLNNLGDAEQCRFIRDSA